MASCLILASFRSRAIDRTWLSKRYSSRLRGERWRSDRNGKAAAPPRQPVRDHHVARLDPGRRSTVRRPHRPALVDEVDDACQCANQPRGTSTWQGLQHADTSAAPSQDFTLLSRGSKVRVLPGAPAFARAISARASAGTPCRARRRTTLWCCEGGPGAPSSRCW